MDNAEISRVTLAIGLVMVFFPLLPAGMLANTVEVELKLQNLKLQSSVSSGEHTALAIDAFLNTDRGMLHISSDSSLGRNTIELPEAGEWSITCSSARLWCPTVKAEIGALGARLELPAFLATQIEGRFIAAENELEKLEVLIQGRLLDESKKEAFLEFAQELTLEGAAFNFKAPFGMLDLRFSAMDWVPIYVWSLPATQRINSLGELRVIRGGSVSGFVTSEEEIPKEGVWVGLAAVGEPRAEPEDGPPVYLREGLSNGPGFFQFGGVAPGRYRVLAGPKGQVVASSEVFEIQSEFETFLTQPIHLRRPLDILVSVEPPRGPGDEPWLLEIVCVSPGSTFEDLLEVDERGYAAIEGLLVGRYEVTLWSAAGAPVEQREIIVEDSSPIEISIPLVRVVGHIHAGKEDLEAEIGLQTGRGDHWEFRSNAEGEFTGLMREPKHLVIATVVPKGGERVQMRLEDIGTREEDVLFLDIDLSQGRLWGFVVDEDGSPISRARVAVRKVEDSVSTSTGQSDSEGRFELSGLQAGGYSVRASHPLHGEADTIQAEVLQGGEVAQLRLVLHPREALAGRVVRGDGLAVAGAEVRILVLGRGSDIATATTDADGTFTVDLPADTGRAVVQVLAPAQFAWSECRQLEKGKELILRAPGTDGGDLQIEIIGDPSRPPALGGEIILLTGTGGFFSSSLLSAWAKRVGRPPARRQRIVSREEIHELDEIPALVAGSYALSWSGKPWWELVDHACHLGRGEELDWEALGAGTTTLLSYDVRKHQGFGARQEAQ